MRRRTGQVAQAIRVAEKVCHLSPGDAVPYANLSYLNNVVGNVPQAVLAMAHAVNCDTDGTDYQALFARLTDHLEFYELNAETTVIGQAIELCLANPGIDAEAFSTAWHSLLLLEPDFKRFASITRGGSFEEQSEQLDLAEIARPLTAPFFLLGLRSLHAIDSRLERILTLFRRLFISRFDDYDLKVFLPFLCALAEHCYLNEYVYGCTKEEQGMVDSLETGLDISAETNVNMESRIALLAATGTWRASTAWTLSKVPAPVRKMRRLCAL